MKSHEIPIFTHKIPRELAAVPMKNMGLKWEKNQRFSGFLDGKRVIFVGFRKKSDFLDSSRKTQHFRFIDPSSYSYHTLPSSNLNGSSEAPVKTSCASWGTSLYYKHLPSVHVARGEEWGQLCNLSLQMGYLFYFILMFFMTLMMVNMTFRQFPSRRDEYHGMNCNLHGQHDDFSSLSSTFF